MRRRRRSAAEADEPAEVPTPDLDDPRSAGPWDVSEQPAAAEAEDRVDLGPLSILPPEGAELRLQVDEQSGTVVALLLADPEGAMDLRLFAAPRHQDTWPDMVDAIVEEAKRQGGTAEEAEGPFGTAVRVAVPVVGPDGKQVVQPSTMHGISGPRWLLRATMFGRPATDYDPEATLETALRSVVVDRGAEAMAPGDLLPLRLPPGAAPLEPQTPPTS